MMKVLIVDGFSNHDWEATTKAIRTMLSGDPHIRIDVSTVPPIGTEAWKQWSPSFSAYDVVIQNTNDLSKKGDWPASVKGRLEAYVADGGGMLVFHSANNAFRSWGEYNRMIGLGWRGKGDGSAIVVRNGLPDLIAPGQGENTSHGARVDVTVRRLGDHPIHSGLPEEWMAADLEVYRYARGPAENLTVLSCARDEKTGLQFPTEWVVAYGKGRVYNSTFGHYWHGLDAAPPGMRCAGFQTILRRALYWLAGEDVPVEVPKDFPTRDRISLRE